MAPFRLYRSTMGTLKAYATFSVGIVARPLGGAIFGHYGDRIGRKSMLVYSLSLMGAATALLGLLPTHATIGVWAPVGLTVLRFVQGIGVGGEWAGAVLMAVEHSGGSRRGSHGSWPQMGVPAGSLLATGVFALFSTGLGEEQFLARGWRVPFLLSVILIAIGLFIRLRLLETPAFARVKEADRGRHAADPDFLLGFPRLLAWLAGFVAVTAVVMSLMLVLLFVLLTALLRVRVGGAGALWLIYTLVFVLGARPLPEQLPFYAAAAAVVVWVVVRHGLLALAMMYLFGALLFEPLATTRLGEWYSEPAALSYLLAAGLIGWGLYASVSGRPFRLEQLLER